MGQIVSADLLQECKGWRILEGKDAEREFILQFTLRCWKQIRLLPIENRFGPMRPFRFRLQNVVCPMRPFVFLGYATDVESFRPDEAYDLLDLNNFV